MCHVWSLHSALQLSQQSWYNNNQHINTTHKTHNIPIIGGVSKVEILYFFLHTTGAIIHLGFSWFNAGAQL